MASYWLKIASYDVQGAFQLAKEKIKGSTGFLLAKECGRHHILETTSSLGFYISLGSCGSFQLAARLGTVHISQFLTDVWITLRVLRSQPLTHLLEDFCLQHRSLSLQHGKRTFWSGRHAPAAAKSTPCALQCGSKA